MPVISVTLLPGVARSQSIRRIAKTELTYDESWQSDLTVVYCKGLLSGEWPDGSEFKNIRFLDRFEVVKGKLQRQDVWNDLAEMRAKR